MTEQSLAFYMHDLAGGGVERMRLTLIKELRSRGFRVTLVVASKRGPLACTLPSDLPVIELGSSRMLASVWPLVRYLRRHRPDVLVSSLDHNNITALLAGLAARGKTKIVICQHNALSAERTLGWRYRAVPWLYWLLQRLAHGIVAVSNGVADDLVTAAAIPRSRITRIYNPVLDAGFVDRAQQAIHHPWLDQPDRPVFVFAGRLTEQKDPETLIQAFFQLVQRTPARLVVLGDGPLLPRLQSLVADCGVDHSVEFRGFESNPLPWVRRATALVLCSRYEGLGNVIVEALACGTPVIATDCPHGPAEILQGGKYGRLVPVNDASGLAQALFEQTLVVHAGREILQSRASAFTASSCADAHEALFTAMRKTSSPVRAFGLAISALRADQIVSRMLSELPAAVKLVVTPNIDHIRLLARNPDLASAYGAAEIISPDGFPVLLYAKLRGLTSNARVTGCEIFHLLANNPAVQRERLCLVVESEATHGATVNWARERGLSRQIRVIVAPAGLHANGSAQNDLVDAISEFAPTILVMTLGAPVSEVFVHRHRNKLPPCWAICVGQAVRVELGMTRRAPLLWGRLGCEWLWRLRQEPRRLVARYARSAMWFPFAVAQDLLTAHRSERQPPYSEAGTPASANT